MTAVLLSPPFVLSAVEVRASNAVPCSTSLDFAQDERGMIVMRMPL